MSLIRRVDASSALPCQQAEEVSSAACEPFTLQQEGFSFGSSIIPQVPSFAVSEERQCPPMTPRTSAACDHVERSADLFAVDWSETPSPLDAPTTTGSFDQTHTGQQDGKYMSGVFAKSPQLALTFHVLAGPLQKIAELNITVSGTFHFGTYHA